MKANLFPLKTTHRPRLSLFLALGMVTGSSYTTRAQATVQFVSSSYTVAESLGPVTLTVQRTGDANDPVNVDYSTADGTATNGLKYTGVSGKLTFEPGQTNQSLIVPILNEALVEGSRYFRVLLTNASAGAVLGDRTNAVVTITDNDFGFQFQFPSFMVAEDAGAVAIRVIRDDDGAVPVTVDFSTTDGSAVNGVDFLGTTNTLSFGAQERLKLVPVTILNNIIKQPNRFFRIDLANPGGASLGSVKTATVTIVDNDQGFQFESSSYSVAQDAGVVRLGVLRGTDDTNSVVTVDFASTDLSATSGTDYSGVTNTLRFGPGERRQWVTVPLLNRGLKAPTRTFRGTLSNPTGGAVLGTPAGATVAIINSNPGVGFEAGRYTNLWGTAAATLTVLRGNSAALGPISVDYATGDLTAKAGVDYQAASNTLHFAQDETVRSISIPLFQPRASPGSKSFSVTLANPTGGATLGTASALVSVVGSFVTVSPLFNTLLNIHREQGVDVVSWGGGGQFQRADDPAGPWQTVSNATSPYAIQSPVRRSFYRVTRPRPVNLYVPSSYDGQTPVALVILLHGYSYTGVDMENWMHLQPFAESRGFLYCYPDSETDPTGAEFWNGTDACCDQWSVGGDDAGYLRALIEQVGQQFVLDRKRVYLIGHSNGGYLAYHTACQHADLIAAIASLAGSTFLDPNRCAPSQPVNILQIHGKADEWQFYAGGANVIFHGTTPTGWQANLPPFPSAPQSVQIWAGYNGATGLLTEPAPTLDLIDDVAGLETVVTRYTNAPPGGAVELWTMLGGTHFPKQFSSQFAPLVLDWLFAHPKP